MYNVWIVFYSDFAQFALLLHARLLLCYIFVCTVCNTFPRTKFPLDSPCMSNFDAIIITCGSAEVRLLNMVKIR